MAFARSSALVLSLLVLTAATAHAAGQVGEPAANFSLPSAGGATPGPIHSLSDYDGKVRFLFMFGHG
jgi:hypothetical protein